MTDTTRLHFYDYHNIVYKHFYEKNTIIARFRSCYVSSIWSICHIFNGNKHTVDTGIYIKPLIKYLPTFVGNLHH